MLRSVVAASLVLVSTAALADSKIDCLDSKDHDLRIQGCSAMIQHNPKDVIAYHNRGDAYGLKGDLDRAISDYTKAIELNPNFAPAYNGRGRAYTSKGDYIHAVADVTKAGELIPKVPKVRPWPAVVKAAPPKAKPGALAGMAVPAKPIGVEKPPSTTKAPVVEKPSIPGKAAEKSSPAGKAAVVEKPSEDSWPPWAQSKLAN
jgi:tetratricopeptide (TPR) repeat protein